MAVLTRRLPILLFVLINGLVLFNAVAHPPQVGYDAWDHIRYIEVLSEGRLPGPRDSRAFFSPPLSYLGPALARQAGIVGRLGAAKLFQLSNVFWSVLLTASLLRICRRLRPRDFVFQSAALGFLGMIPAYYKTFAFVRPDPLMAALMLGSAAFALEGFILGPVHWPKTAAAGLFLGLALLARQWAFHLAASYALFGALLAWKAGARWRKVAGATGGMLIIAMLVGGWFYVGLRRSYGTAMAFNDRLAPSFSLANQPRHFYFDAALSKLFSDPLRPSFPNRLIPMFYSEFWGDYQCYFLVHAKERGRTGFISGYTLQKIIERDPETAPSLLETNRFRIGAYLGRVNLLSLLPSGFLAGGVFLGLTCLIASWRQDHSRLGPECGGLAFFHLALLVSCAGYFWYLLMCLHWDTGSPIKASYLVYAFPWLAVGAAEVLRRLRDRSRPLFTAASAGLGLVALHNLPACVTHYWARG